VSRARLTWAGFDYVLDKPVTLTRVEWQERIDKAKREKRKVRRDSDVGEIFIHGADLKIEAEIYVRDGEAGGTLL